jgi:hypothetical protein
MEEFMNINMSIWYYPTGEIINGNAAYIEIYWFMLNYENGLYVSEVICNDGTINLIDLYN